MIGRIRLQLVEQMAAVRERPIACRGHQMMRLFAPDVRRQRHHHRLGRDHASRHVEIAPHARRIDDQALEQRPGVVQRACAQRERLRQRDPLRVPRAGRALVVLHHRVQHDRDQLADVPGAGEDELAGDRVALLRHGAAAAASLLIGLRDLADLGLHQERDVGRDLAERAGEQAKEACDLGEAVAADVPGDGRRAQAELRGEPVHHADAVRAERGERADGPAELHHRYFGPEAGEPLGMALQGGEPQRALEAEGDRQRMLGVGAPGHRRVAVAARQVDQGSLAARQILVDQLERLAQLQHQPGVHDVLSRRAPMHPAAGVARAGLAERFDQRHDGIADQLGAAADRGEIKA